MENIPKPQAQQSRQWLADALLELMKEKNFANISVCEIARQADLDRRTFYRHFRSKQDVLRFYIRSLTADYESVFLPRADFTPTSIAASFFLVCEKHKETLVLLNEHDLLSVVLEEMNRIFPDYHSKHHTYPKSYPGKGVSAEYAMACYVGAFWNLMCRWVEDGFSRTPQQMGQILGALFSEQL